MLDCVSEVADSLSVGVIRSVCLAGHWGRVTSLSSLYKHTSSWPINSMTANSRLSHKQLPIGLKLG